MILKVVIDGHSTSVSVAEEILSGAQDFFAQMDADMDKGWQMSYHWVDNPDSVQRCQIAGDKILGAFELENKRLLQMMSAYILYKLPGITEIHVSTDGDMNATEVVVGN
ncbi:MAG: hypothetical protein OEY89_06120 [Gammaproteobacteria bacterium]|nr:hypothetical protein [Gammaproteobacteria bacterium]